MAPPAKRRKRNVMPDWDENNYIASSKTGPGAAAKKSGVKIADDTLASYHVSPPDTTPVRDEAARQASPQSSPARKLAARFALSASTRSRANKSTSESPSSSAEKARTTRETTLAATGAKSRTADLRTFFTRQSQGKQGNGGSRESSAKDSAKTRGVEDIVSDPISEDDELAAHKAAESSFVGKKAQKRSKGRENVVSGAAATRTRFLRPSQPRMGPPDPPRAIPKDTGPVDSRPWSERFGPSSLDELAMHKRKVEDVRRWLEDVFAGRMSQRLLVLKGPAGTAKSTAVQLLARDMGCEILEWRNPASSYGAVSGYQSTSAQFAEFLGRGSKFGQLDVDSDSTEPAPVAGKDGYRDSERRLMLIEEFPNTFLRSSSVVTCFRRTMMQFLAASTALEHASGTDPIVPIVMVISEALLTTTSAAADSFTAHRLLGPEILRHAGTTVIEINPIAPTILGKALELVVRKEAKQSGRRRTPGPRVLQRLGEIGDIRNAIASLEFLCLKGDEQADWGAELARAKSKRGATKTAAMTKSEQDKVELVSQRESSLGIFHAAGKVVYNKREEQPYAPGSVEAATETLPDFMALHSRPNRSQVSVDSLIDETGTDADTFISALHENYLLSCEASDPSEPKSSLDYIIGCIEHLSESDLLCPSWDAFFGGRGLIGRNLGLGRDTGSHVLRQDEIAFHTAVRGLLFSLPGRVRRKSQARGGRGGGVDAYKMFYPTSLKLWRAKEELEGLVDMWATKMLAGDDLFSTSSLTDGAAAFRRPQSMIRKAGGTTAKDKLDEAPALLSLGTAARRELVLERLPYIAQMARRKTTSKLGALLRAKDLELVVAFKGIGPSKTDGQSEEEDAADELRLTLGAGGETETWATDRSVEAGSTPRKPKAGRGLGAMLTRSRKDMSYGSASSQVVGLDGGLEGLVLSDDDIEN